MADRVSPLPLPWPPQGHFIRGLAPSTSGATPSVFIALLAWGLPTPPTTCFCAHTLGLLPQQLFQAVLKAALRDGRAPEQPVARLLPGEPDLPGAAGGSPISEYCVTSRSQRTGAWPDGSPSDPPPPCHQSQPSVPFFVFPNPHSLWEAEALPPVLLLKALLRLGEWLPETKPQVIVSAAPASRVCGFQGQTVGGDGIGSG